MSISTNPRNLKSAKPIMKQAALATVVVTTAVFCIGQASSPPSASTSSPQRAPRVFIEWKNTGIFPSQASQPADETKAFNQACPEAVAITDEKDADLILRMNHQTGPGSAELYRWQIQGRSKGNHTSEESRANLDLVLHHACRAVMKLWQAQ